MAYDNNMLYQFVSRNDFKSFVWREEQYDSQCFKLVSYNSLSETERKRALYSLIFRTDKKDGRIKARYCANGNPQLKWMDRDEVSSPTVTTEAIMITGVIEALEGRDVVTYNIPNAFVQTELNEHDLDGHRTIMKIRGPLVDILIEMDSDMRSLWLQDRMKLYYMCRYSKHYIACWYQQCYSTRNSRMNS